jgi:signal transduction histidine kinase/HPt (histidine-containing phosphotransfer) domain-containing protein
MPSMSADTVRERDSDHSIFAGRIDILYTLGRNFLSLPFAVLCVLAKLFSGGQLGIFPFLPLVLQIVVAVAAERLTTAYKLRPADADPHFWAHRYTFVSAVAGATWGVGVFFWLVPGSFVAQSYLCLAFMGMTSTEFIARCAHRPAYLAHVVFSLGPLIVMLLIQGTPYHIMTAILVLCFGALLVSYCNSMARLLDESIRVKFDNLGLVQKLSEEKQQVVVARDAAEASASAKSAFISNISHELRTPVNALLGMAQLMSNADLGRPHSDHLKVMLNASYGLQTLIDDVIALTQDGDRPPADCECDPVQAVKAVAHTLQPRALEKGLRLTTAMDFDLPPVAADPRRVRQALLKLADNAVKFTESGGAEIRAEALRRGGREYVRFTVSDTGLGVPAEAMPKLYKPFSPGDASYSRSDQGAGLGLAVVKHIVEAAGGETGFDSQPGHGATFWFDLPAGRSHVSNDGAEHHSVHAPSDLNLLVRSANPDVQAWLIRTLEPFGNRLFTARTPSEAITLARREELDAILVTGKEANMLAASAGVRAPIIAFLTDDERAPVCAHAVLRWPAKPQRIYEALAEICGSGKSNVVALPGEDMTAAIDPKAFAALEKSVGAKTLVEILTSYVESAESLCAALGAASSEDDWDQATRLAQDIAGSASGLGLLAVTAAARSFATAAREGADPPTLRDKAQKVVVQYERVRKALVDLYPELAA